MFAEIRNNHMFGPAVEPGVTSPDEAGLFAGICIDGWKTGNDDETGEVIAQVLMSKSGDIITAWHNNGARLNKPVLNAIEEAKQALKSLWDEQTTGKKYLYLKDSQGDLDLILVHNYDATFKTTLNQVYADWLETQSDNHDEIYAGLRAAGYELDVIPCDVVFPGV